MEIAINSAEFSLNAIFIDGLPSIPSLRLQYDPPWDETSIGDHFHVMPLMAIGDVQLAYGMPTDIGAIEFLVVSHANDVLLSQQNPAKFRQTVAERGAMLRDSMDQARKYLVSEAMAIPPSDPEEMKSHLFAVSSEAGYGDISMARSTGSEMGKFTESRSSLLSFATEAIAEDGLLQDSPGYQQLTTLLADHADLVEAERRRIFDMKFGDAIEKAVGLRLHQEEIARQMALKTE
jgi:hypothetical protein